jgi:DNA-binding transcriptional regulator YbjK
MNRAQPDPNQAGSTRRSDLAAAALTVLGDHGPRGFSHRAVDAAAGLPPGSVNYYAPTRARLFRLALEALFAQDFAVAAQWFTPADAQPTLTAEEGIDRMLGFLAAMTTPAARGRVVARHHLLGEAQHDPELRAVFDTHRGQFTELANRYMSSTSGIEATAGAVEAIVALLDGFIARQVLVGSTRLAETVLRAALEAVVYDLGASVDTTSGTD